LQKIKVFINGFGRIGRSTLRILLQKERFEVVGINDIYPFSQMRDLLKYDSIYKEFEKEVILDNNRLLIEGSKIKLYNLKDPKDLNLEGVDLLLECSGLYLTKESNEIFLSQGAKRVIISTPPKDDMPRFIIDVNHKEFRGEKIVSNSSCSANAIVPILKILDSSFTITSASFSMFHSYTAYQKLLDVKHYSKDIRRSRSATQNIEPLMSSADGEVLSFFPHLKNRLYAKSIRVPLSATTLYDITLSIKEKTKVDSLNTLLTEGAKNYDKISINKKPLVSSDFIKDENAAVIDLTLTQIVDKDLIKVFAWQDNEYGYAYQLVRLAEELG